MRQTFKKWCEANKHAQTYANTSGVSQGIEYSSYDHVWLVRPLPGKDRRYGIDLLCEAVEPEVSR